MWSKYWILYETITFEFITPGMLVSCEVESSCPLSGALQAEDLRSELWLPEGYIWQKLREMSWTYRTSSVIYFTFQNQPSEQTRFWKYLYHKLSQVSYSSFWKCHFPKSSAIQKFHWCSLLAIIYACQWNPKGQLDTLTFNAVVRGSKLVVSYCVHTRVIYTAFAHIEQ